MDIEPVAVWEGISTKRTINTVEGAALFMLHRWPADHMSTLVSVAARTAALQALEGSISPETFRLAFVAAALEADMLAPAEEAARELPGHVARPWDFQKRKRKR